MPASVEQTYKIKFESGLTFQFQQTQARLLPYVKYRTIEGTRTSHDRLHPIWPLETPVGRLAVITDSEATYSRRWILPTIAHQSVGIDFQDVHKAMFDPGSDILQNIVSGINRLTDLRITNAALGAAYTGETGTTAVTLPAGQKVAVDYVESGSAANSNLTIGKLRQARFLLDQSEVLGSDASADCVIIATHYQKRSLLTRVEATSSDYAAVKALVNGEIDTFMGFKFIFFGDSPTGTGANFSILPKSGNIRRIIAMKNKAVSYGEQEGLVTEYGQIANAHKGSMRAYARKVNGAVRDWEEAVVEISCDESLV